jgi:predicted Zn-dependent protease
VRIPLAKRRLRDLLVLFAICLCVTGFNKTKNLYFVPIGDAPTSEIEALVTHYREKFGIEIHVLSPIVASPSDLDTNRQQLIAENVIQTMLRSYPNYASDASSVLIGITGQDIYPRGVGWRFCFGWRISEAHSAIVSTARMNLEYPGEPLVEATLEQRLRKTVTKDIGILYYGMSPNNNPQSVLYGGILGIQELDRVSEEFSPGIQIRKFSNFLVPIVLLILMVSFLAYGILRRRTDTENRAIGNLCSKCGHSSYAVSCPVCGNGMPDSAEARTRVNKSLNYYPLPSVVGLFGILIAAHSYPPIGMNPVMGVSLMLFFTPMLAHVGFSVRRQVSLRVSLLKKIYEGAAVVLIIFAGFVFLNGSLDKYPSVQAHTRVSRKDVTRGRGGPSYSLMVSPSWRTGRIEERLEVSGTTFSMVQAGEPVLVVVHPGVFRLPWFSNVLPE